MFEKEVNLRIFLSAGNNDQKDSDSGKKTIPEQSDLFVVLSSDAPHPSKRIKKGTHILQEFVKAIKLYGENLDLIYILLVVIHEVADKMMTNSEGCYSKQNPCFKSYMRNLFFFPPQSLNSIEGVCGYSPKETEKTTKWQKFRKSFQSKKL